MGCALAVSLLLSQLPVSTVSLAYEAPPELACPDEATLRRLIAARLGNDPFVDDGTARVTVRLKAGSPLIAEVALENPRGAPPRRKALSSSDCTSLIESVALTVALSVDPLVRPASPPPSRAPEPPRTPEPAPEPRRTPLPAGAPVEKPTPTPAPSLRGSLSVGASVNAGLSVGAQPNLRLEGRLHGSRWSLGLEGRFGWPMTGALAEGALTTSTVLGAVLPCLTWRWVSGCAEVAAGALRLGGQGLMAERQATVFHASVGLRAVFDVPLGEWFSLGVMGEVLVPLTRASALVGTTRVWTVWPVGGGLGVRATLWL